MKYIEEDAIKNNQIHEIEQSLINITAEINAIEDFRHTHIAHSLAKELTHKINYGPLFKTVMIVANIVNNLDILIYNNSFDYDFQKQQYKKCADEFWSHFMKSDI